MFPTPLPFSAGSWRSWTRKRAAPHRSIAFRNAASERRVYHLRQDFRVRAYFRAPLALAGPLAAEDTFHAAQHFTLGTRSAGDGSPAGNHHPRQGAAVRAE